MTRRPRYSTLFPYTTLFQSEEAIEERESRAGGFHQGGQDDHRGSQPARAASAVQADREEAQEIPRARRGRSRQDGRHRADHGVPAVEPHEALAADRSGPARPASGRAAGGVGRKSIVGGGWRPPVTGARATL